MSRSTRTAISVVLIAAFVMIATRGIVDDEWPHLAVTLGIAIALTALTVSPEPRRTAAP